MKRMIFFKITASLSLMAFVMMGCEKETIIAAPDNSTPAATSGVSTSAGSNNGSSTGTNASTGSGAVSNTAIQQYVATHFPNNSIIHSNTDYDDFTVTYHVTLSNGVDLEFNNRMEIIDIDSNGPLPSSVIPANIRAFISGNYPNSFITDWELDYNVQHIQLNNGLDLDFTTDGRFLGIDD